MGRATRLSGLAAIFFALGLSYKLFPHGIVARLVRRLIASLAGKTSKKTVLEDDPDDVPGAAAAPGRGPTTCDELIDAGVPLVQPEFHPNEDYVAQLFRLAATVAKTTPMGRGAVERMNGRGGSSSAVALLTRPEDVARLMNESTAHNNMSKHLRDSTLEFVGKRSLFALEGDAWREQRALLKSVLSPQLVARDMLVPFEKISFRVTKLLSDHVKSKSLYVDVHAMFTRLHLSATCLALTGDDLGFFKEKGVFSTGTSTGHEEIIEGFEFLLRELPKRAAIVETNQATPEDDLTWRRQAAESRRAVKEIVTQRLDHQKNPAREDVLSSLIRYYSTTGAKREDLIEDVTDNVIEMLFAGYNTVAVGLSFSLFYLAQNPAWYAEVLAEVDAALRDHDFSKSGTPLNLEALPLLKGVFHESLRLVPPTAFTARTTSKTVTFDDGVRIPINTDVIIPIVFVNQNPATWGQDAALFNPKRFVAPRDATIRPGAFLPFSYGPRNCVGEHLARAEALTALAVLLKFFTFEILPGSRQNPKWTGFGCRPYDQSLDKVAMTLKCVRRDKR